MTHEPFEAEDLIRQAIKRYGDTLCIACSFGKDSIVPVHMALQYDSNIKIMFNNGLAEFAENIRYKKDIVTDWGINLIETKPEKGETFWPCAEKYGLPTVRKSGGSGPNQPKCCYYLKEKPAMKASPTD